MRLTTAILILLVSTTFVWAAPVESVVHICKTETEGKAYGSGTVIASDKGKSLILSVAHVVDGEGDYTITLKDKVYKAKFYAGSKVTYHKEAEGIRLEIDGPDLALLSVEAELPSVAIAKESVKEGDTVRYWGYQSGKLSKYAPHYKEGKVVDPTETFTTADSRRGDSGSGLFNSSEQLVGVVHARPKQEDEVGSYAIPLSDLRTFLKANAKNWLIE